MILSNFHLQKIVYFLLFAIYCQISVSQCISGDCENGNGTYIYPDMTKIEGDWKKGEPNGKCKISKTNGDVYEGDMLNGERNGFGKYIFKNGDYYEGNYKNGIHHGYGKIVKTNGYSEEGKFINDSLNGNATITFSKGAKYVGFVKNNLLDGSGIYYFSNGDKFEGIFKNGDRNGQGILYFAKGGLLKGVWLNDEFVSGSNEKNNNKNSITPILSDGNVYEVNVTLNDVLKLDMIFDTGASEVYFTPDIVMTLIKTKTITDEDILEGGVFVDANGNVNKGLRFNLRSMMIGNNKIENIPCGVSKNVDGSNLLGLSALKKLGKFEFDFKNSTIKF